MVINPIVQIKKTLKQIQVNIDTKNDGLEQCTSFQTWLFPVSMIDFEGVSHTKEHMLSSQKDSHKIFTPPQKGWGLSGFFWYQRNKNLWGMVTGWWVETTHCTPQVGPNSRPLLRDNGCKLNPLIRDPGYFLGGKPRGIGEVQYP